MALFRSTRTGICAIFRRARRTPPYGNSDYHRRACHARLFVVWVCPYFAILARAARPTRLLCLIIDGFMCRAGCIFSR